MDLTGIFQAAHRASAALAKLDDAQISSFLVSLARGVEDSAQTILEANERDLKRMDPDDPRYDRLRLSPERIHDIASDMRNVASLPSPLGKTISEWRRPNGMTIRKVSVPFGVIGVVYEARPNVTFDVFSLCFKAGSACLLKGGSDAEDTNVCCVAIIRQALQDAGMTPDMVSLLPSTHEATAQMLSASGWIDVIIPRGSRRLIEYVRRNSLVPVIETGAGVCHTYFHRSGDIATGRDIIFNAKTRRVSVCNALDCLVIDRQRLADLPAICYHLSEKNVIIYADDDAYAALHGAYRLLEKASEDDFGKEWLDYKMSIKTVEDIDEAIDFISGHTSHHSECIVAENREAINRFLSDIDAACVYANVSTAFTDGGQFGFGAEIGISTQKLHARGPMALPEITTYKYLITGSGQIR